MIPDKHPKEEFFWLGVRWTPGARKLIVWAAVAVFGGGLLGFWDQIASWLSMAPVWAFIGLFALGIIYHPAALAAASPPDDVARFRTVALEYDRDRSIFL